MTHPEEVVPFTVKDFDLLDASGNVLVSVRDHHGARFEWTSGNAITTDVLKLKVHATHGTPAAVFRVRAYRRLTTARSHVGPQKIRHR